MDADLRNPSLHTKLSLSNTIGLSNYLAGASLPPEVIQKTDQPNLMFMASGPLPSNAPDLLSGTRIFSLVSLAAEMCDLVILDSPPLLGLTDAQLLASAVGATVLVIGAGEKSKDDIQAALRLLQISRAMVVGAVLSKFDPNSVGYTYGYRYGNGYRYADGHRYGFGYAGEVYPYSYGGSVASSNQIRLGEQASN